MMKLLAYPDKVIETAKLYNICEQLNIEITYDINDFDVAIYWNLNPNEKCTMDFPMINKNLTCVLKSCVDKAWGLAAGYSITIDPRNPPKEYVRKSQQQWRSHTGEIHDGRIFYKSQKYDKEYVYQKLIHNEYKEYFRVLRIPVFGKSIPCLFIKDGIHRFKGKGPVQIVKLLDYISPIEVKTILHFCEIMGVEYADIDLLRDTDGRLYAIDVNNISGDGISHRIKEPEKLKNLLAQTFKKEFLDEIC